jgi:hypothetical protein
MNLKKLPDSRGAGNDRARAETRAAHPRGRAPAERTAVSLPVLLRARAEARALLWQCGEFDLPTAVDALQAFAVETGMLDQIGQDAVQRILRDAFHSVRGRL